MTGFAITVAHQLGVPGTFLSNHPHTCIHMLPTNQMSANLIKERIRMENTEQVSTGYAYHGGPNVCAMYRRPVTIILPCSVLIHFDNAPIAWNFWLLSLHYCM